VVRDDQPDAREGQAGRPEVAERYAVPLKPGNAVGGNSSRQTQYAVRDLEIGQPINSEECSEAVLRLGKSALSGAINDRCDMTVATAVVPHDQAATVEPGVMNFLNSTRVAEIVLGLCPQRTQLLAHPASAMGHDQISGLTALVR
jgi:hypothetical protein